MTIGKKRRFSPLLRQCFVTSTVGINLVGHGALTGYPAVLLPQFHTHDSEVKSTDTMDSWIASVLALIILIGGFMTPTITDRFGRKLVHYIISVGSAVGWLVTILAKSVEVILLGRIIGGLAYGMMLPLCSVLIGEYTSPKNRGGFLTTISLTLGFGIFFVHLIGSLLTWRNTALVCLFIPLTSLVMTIFIPESPSWLVYKGKYDECRKVFRWLRGDEEEEELEAMIQARINFKTVNQEKLDIFGSIRKREFYKPIILMLHINALTQLSGAAITAAYSTTIIRLIMNPTVRADVWMVVLDTERIIINTVAIFIINRFKRRTMLFSTLGGCIISLLAISGYVYSRTSGLLASDILWIPGTLMVLHFLTIALGMMPLPGVIAGEVFPLQYRSISGAISLVSVSGNMFLALKTFPSLVESIGISGAYAVYAGILAYCMIVIWFLLPETMGRTLQDIEDEYRGIVKDKDIEETQSLNEKNGENAE